MAGENVDDFASSFEELLKVKDGESPPSTFGKAPATTEVVDAATKTAAEKQADDDKAVADAAAAAAADKGAAGDGGEEGDLPSPEQQAAELEAQRAAEADKTKKPASAEPDRLEAAIEKLATRLAPTEKPADQQQQRQQPQQQPLFAAEEVAQIQNYYKEFPDIARAEQSLRRAEQRQLAGYMFSEIEKRLAPLAQLVDQLAGRTFTTDLHTAVPDYNETTRTQVLEWVTKQPAYLQPAYKHVVEQGTVEEVADLIARYKAESGGTKPAAASASTETELPSTTKKAVAALAPVGSKRTAAATGAPSKDDFEGAFKEAAAADL